MAYEQRPGQFALFKNDKKGSEKAPDYRGDGLDLQGNAIEIAAWIKDGKKGKFMSCNFKPKGQRPEPKQEAKPESKPPGNFKDMDDDIPW